MASGLLHLLILCAYPIFAASAPGVPLTTLDSANRFDGIDYLIPVNYNFATQYSASTCAEADDLMVTGVTRLTGQVSCIKKTATACPAATFADSLRANTTYPPRLDFNCRPIAKANCPTDYVWQRLNLAALDPGPAGSPALDCSGVGTCVYRYANNIPWQRNFPPGQTSVSGTVCNPDVYRASPSGACAAVVVLSIPGVCYYQCPPCNHHGCSTCSSAAQPSVSTSYSASGPNVSCSLVKNQPCGSYISAYVSWGGTCVINAPETAAPQGACSP